MIKTQESIFDISFMVMKRVQAQDYDEILFESHCKDGCREHVIVRGYKKRRKHFKSGKGLMNFLWGK